MQGNILGQSGGSNFLGLKVYQQLKEPAKKDGVWIKTSSKSKNIFMANFKDLENKFVQQASVPNDRNLFLNAGAAVGDDIYMFGRYNYNSDTEKECSYKFDTIKNEYTTLTSCPHDFGEHSAIAIGTDIYIMGEWNYKYDTLNNEFTSLSNIYEVMGVSLNSLQRTRATKIGTDIYFVIEDFSSYRIQKIFI